MARTVDDTLVKLEKTQAALENARKRIEFLQTENAALIAELNKYAKYAVDVPYAKLATKIEAIKRECKYGFTHFCDGKINGSVAEEGTKPLPPCPYKSKCELRKTKIIKKGTERDE